MKNKNLIITVLIMVLVGGIAFFGGMKYQQSKVKSFAGQFIGRNGEVGGRQAGLGNQSGNRNGMIPVAGEVTAKDDKSITLKTNDGGSKIIVYSSSTVVNKTDTGSIEDVKVGENINVFGTSNTDGSVTAQNIQIGVLMRNANPPSTAGN